jgi:mRNA interferase RelE/StbE
MFEIVAVKSFKKDLKIIPNHIKRKLKDILEKLKENPFSLPYKKLKGYDDLYRIRIGEYRLIYRVIKIEKKIILLHIIHRQRVYKNL